MRFVVVLVAVLALATPAVANSPLEKLVFWTQVNRDRNPTTEVRSARIAAGIVANFLAPPGQRAPRGIYNCRPGTCQFRTDGTSRCRGTLKMRPLGGGFYDVWFARLRCR